MRELLLATLMCDGTTKTYVFDSGAEVVMWLGRNVTSDATDAFVCLSAADRHVAVSPVRGYELVNASGNRTDKAVLEENAETVFSIRLQGVPFASLFLRPSTPGARSYVNLGFAYDASVSIGRDESCAFSYRSRFVSGLHARLDLVGERFSITDCQSANGTFVNGKALDSGSTSALNAGDIVQIMDLTMLIGHRFVCMNQLESVAVSPIDGASFIDHDAFAKACPPASETTGKVDLFYPAPRLAHSVHSRAFQVDDPPMAKKPDDSPALMQLGPSFVMGIASIFTISSAVSRLMTGANMMTTMPMIAMSVAMLSGTVVWPIVSKRYNKKRDAREELKRTSAYTDYLNGMEAKFLEEANTQAQILHSTRVDVASLLDRAAQRSPRLMNRSLDQDDFMNLRVGIGDVELKAEVRWPQHRFSLDDDALMDKVNALATNPPKVREVPLEFDPYEHKVAGIVGSRDRVWSFARGLIVQMCALYSYQDVKLALIADDEEKEQWGWMRVLPHIHDEEGITRFIATNSDSLLDLGRRLEHTLDARKDLRIEAPSDFGGYEVVICASSKLAERSEVLTRIAKLRTNRGISLIYFGEDLSDLPRECDYVIDLTAQGTQTFGTPSQELAGDDSSVKRQARMFARGDVSGTMRGFDPDIELDAATARSFALSMARVRLDIPSQRSAMPSSVGFLEMFQSGSVAHLNIARRWAENDASRTLQTPLGLDGQGEYSMLNLHEKAHGPHGLIAGTTGSGKSEFIITYILSMCVNYPPDQVAFVLIDYKGGGLAGAFENERIHLPHLAGTITNLDGAAISRSLVSIKSELKRRQDMLNKARDITGEATVDIYKYLSYYRQGVLTEPLPHLFIVADEFAELKAQEPEFMDELISAARIGRSLGVHLILATQKPTGVVNDQIWSNSKFKVCLKVADAADSKEMIKRPDAAEIKEPGRFYLLVGYNEYFASGQAAYAGAGYVEKEQFEPKKDDAVELIDDTGATLAKLRLPVASKKTNDSELNVVLKQIMATADALDKHAENLWLEPMPDYIELAALEEKYAFTPDPQSLSFAIAELDEPEQQRQMLLSFQLAKEGNIAFYGTAASGTDALLGTLLYGLARNYPTETFSCYIVDMGSGALASFSALPQCGGIVLTGEDEKLENLFRLVEAEIASRRSLLAQFGGFDAYNAQALGGEKLSHIVVAIANMASFTELHADYEERLNTVTRDGVRYGIHFIITAPTASSVRMRLRANFSTSLITAFNDPNDYVTLLGSMSGTVAPKQDKRGLIKIGKVIREFQGASIAEKPSEVTSAVKELGSALHEQGMATAKNIPQLPERVHADDMLAQPRKGHLVVPVGFSKEAVSPAYFDFSKSPSMLVLGNDIEGIGRYLRGLVETLEKGGDLSYRVIDPENVCNIEGNQHVASDGEAAARMVEELVGGESDIEFVAFSSIAQTMSSLPAETSTRLQNYIVEERGAGACGLLFATEMWRVKSMYQDWYKVASAYGNGVWVGSGFADQSIFRFSRALPSYRNPAQRSDGFLCMRGDVTPVRLVEAKGEPDDE